MPSPDLSLTGSKKWLNAMVFISTIATTRYATSAVGLPLKKSSLTLSEQRAQSGQRAPIFKRIVSMIRDFLRSNGLLRHMSEDDIAALIDRSSDFVRRGGAQKLRIRDEMSHEISGHPRDYAFQTAYHGTSHEFDAFRYR